MTALIGSIGAYDAPSRSRSGRIIAVAAAILTPLLLAAAALLSVSADTPTASSGAPALPAAVVNLDEIVTTTVGGTSTPVAAGKLLTTQLSQSGGGFSWTITDQSAADAGLRSGQYAAVVTIPANFSSAYVSSSSTAPVQATLGVQTNGATNYVAQQLAAALSDGIQTSLSSQLTQGFVKGLLAGFTELHSELGTAADGAQKIAAGAGEYAGFVQQAADGSATLSGGVSDLSTGLAALSGGVSALPTVTSELAAGARVTADIAAEVNKGVDDLLLLQLDIDARQLGADLSIDGLLALIRDDPSLTKEQIAVLLGDVQRQTREVQKLSGDMTLGLGIADVATDVLGEASGAVSLGNDGLAAAMPDLAKGTSDAAAGAALIAGGMNEFTTGLQGLASGGGTLAETTTALANGLTTAANAVPTYTDDQQQTLSTVVATPISTSVSDLAAPPNARSAIAGVAIPVALWLGALALFLVLVPIVPEALGSSASSWRVVARSVLPVGGLALVQALTVVIVAVLLGFTAEHHLAAVGLILAMSLAFVALHHGLVTAFGRTGRVLSLAFLTVQVLAAGIIVPLAIGGSWLGQVAAVLPLTQAIRGLQLAITGGDLGAVLGALAALVVVGLVGRVLSLVGTARHRSAAPVRA